MPRPFPPGEDTSIRYPLPRPGPIVPKPSQSTRTALRANIASNHVDLTFDSSDDGASEDD